MSKIHPAHVELRVRPIEAWTGPARGGNKDDRFERSGTQTQSDLRVELAAIGVRQGVIQADITEDDLRNDGLLRASARFRSSRIVLAFKHPKQGPVSFPSWTYQDPWANLRAVVKTLEALRTIARHGVTQNDQQYTGWKQLPPQGTVIVAAEFVTVEDAARFLIGAMSVDPNLPNQPGVIKPETVVRSPGVLQRVYHLAAMNNHPDKGGADEVMRRVNAARDMIERAQRGAA